MDCDFGRHFGTAERSDPSPSSGPVGRGGRGGVRTCRPNPGLHPGLACGSVCTLPWAPCRHRSQPGLCVVVERPHRRNGNAIVGHLCCASAQTSPNTSIFEAHPRHISIASADLAESGQGTCHFQSGSRHAASIHPLLPMTRLHLRSRPSHRPSKTRVADIAASPRRSTHGVCQREGVHCKSPDPNILPLRLGVMTLRPAGSCCHHTAMWWCLQGSMRPNK